MHRYFQKVADLLSSSLEPGEVFLASFAAEDSDFVRLNHGMIRQAGNVRQRVLAVDLVNGKRHAPGETSLTGDESLDRDRVASLVGRLRGTLPHLPEDPHLLYATEVHSTDHHSESRLPSPQEALAAIQDASRGLDLVGIYSGGGIHQGFANSLGQRNWFTSYSFNFDWSLYHQTDKAVKTDYAGFVWDDAEFRRKVDAASRQLEILKREPRTIKPGHYRVYLAPAAVNEILNTLAWGGFGLKDHRSKSTTLIRMVEQGVRLHPSIRLVENVKEGVAAAFQAQGFVKPETTVLIDQGTFANCLASPRSAKEYGLPTNGANDFEAPESVDLSAGPIPQDEVLSRLGTGLYINNLHYLNYSDRPACRMTGMTRFATFWVEGGEIVAPVNVMRFDETVYRVLGENLIGLTRERDLILDTSTYFRRSTGSARVPGALVEGFHFTL